MAALADACARAATVDGDAAWADGVRMAAAWFDGDNDAGVPMWDPATGGGYDGLQADGVNLNQGAESTLALHLDAPAGRALARRRRVTARADRRGASGLRLRPDPSRVVARLFVAGQEVVGAGESRATGVVGRILALDEDDGRGASSTTSIERFGGRHRDLAARSAATPTAIADRLDPDVELSDERWLLLGATFTHEYAIEAAVALQPEHGRPPGPDGRPGGRPPVRDERAGHRRGASVEHRVPDRHWSAADGTVDVDEPAPFAGLGTAHAGIFDARVVPRTASPSSAPTARTPPTCSTTSATRSPTTSSTAGSRPSPPSATPAATQLATAELLGDRRVHLLRSASR